VTGFAISGLKKKIRTIFRNYRVSRHPFFRKVDLSPWAIGKINACTVVSARRRFLYLRIPKSANSTVMATLAHADQGLMPVSAQDMQYVRTSAFERISQTNLSRDAVLEDFFKFTVVRHPFSRIVSAFNDKIVDASGYQRFVRGVVKPGVNDNRSAQEIFDEFLHQLELGMWISDNHHFMPQVSLMALPPNSLNYVGRVESLAEDLNFITREIFGSSQEIVTWAPHASTSILDSNVRLIRRETLTPSQKERLRILYRDDFEAFHYEST
jgi:hypothetical protein